MSAEPPTIAGLTVHEQIGQGGFATVWLATDNALGRQVAVKVLSTRSTDQTTAMRFERECRALGAVAGHPNIVTVHQVGTTPEGYPFLVMGYERGGSLGDRIAGQPLAWTDAVDIGARVAEALEVAHRAGVLHRDVKPANILLGDYGAPKLTDFGIARLVGGPHTTTGSVTTSIAHAPPEVLHGRPPDASADVYSLCSTIHALVTGRPPFFDERDESILPLITRISSAPPPRLPPPVPGSVNDVLARGMAKDPGRRIRSAAELAAQLRAAASGGPGGPPAWSPPGAAGPHPQGDLLPAPSAPAQPAPSWSPPAGQPQATTSTVQAPAAAAPARWPLVAAAAAAAVVVAGLAAALIWMLATGDGDDDAAAASSTSSPAGVTTGPTGEAATPPTADEAAGATTVANGETSSTPTAAATVDSLSTVLLRADDLDGPVITFEERTVESGDDPDHPLASYDYCDAPPDLSEVGAGAIRVLTNDILATDAIVVSSASLASSADAAESVVDELVAVADRCDQFTDGLAQVTVLGATRTAERGEVGLLVASSGLTADVELTVVSIAVGEVIVTLEVSAPAAERERLLVLLVERAGALTS